MSPPGTLRAQADSARQADASRGTDSTRQSDSVRQADTARVSYRTMDVVFLTAGRAEGLRVGDTVAILADSGARGSGAVVLSAALHTASARLIGAAASVAVGQRVRFEPHLAGAEVPSAAAARPWVQALVPSGAPPPATPDSAALARPPLAAAPARMPPRPGERWRASLQLEQLASSTGGVSALSSHQTVASLSLTVPLAPGLSLRTRSTGRWRSGAAARSTGLQGLSVLLYEVEARIAPPGRRWSASVGRFVPTEAMGLGYIDGARLDVRVAPEQHLGLVAGFVPKVQQLGFTTAAKRIGAYWAFGGTAALSGSLAAAADWQDGARRRTLVSAQTYWRASSSLSLSVYADVDVGAPWQTFSGLQLTTAYANLRADLPFGMHGSVGLESHQAILLWESVAAGDTAAPPGRLNGVSASLGRAVLGFRTDLSGSVLKRAGDPTPTYRGSLMVSRRGLFLTASAQHGDLLTYGAVSARLLLPTTALPFTVSLGGTANFTQSAGGALTQWRYSFQPELSRYLGGGFFASLGGDIGTYAGRTSSFLHAGVSYRFR